MLTTSEIIEMKRTPRVAPPTTKLVLYCVHDDHAGPDGQTQDCPIASFTNKELGERILRECNFVFPKKSFFLTPDEELPIDPKSFLDLCSRISPKVEEEPRLLSRVLRKTLHFEAKP